MHLLSVIKFRKYQRPLQQTPERHYIERIEKPDVKNTLCSTQTAWKWAEPTWTDDGTVWFPRLSHGVASTELSWVLKVFWCRWGCGKRIRADLSCCSGETLHGLPVFNLKIIHHGVERWLLIEEWALLFQRAKLGSQHPCGEAHSCL